MYVYAGNNPITYTDLDGNAAHIVFAALICGGIGAIKVACDKKSGREIFSVFVGGAVFGGMVAATGGLSLGSQITGGAMAGVASYFATCSVSGHEATPEGIVVSTVAGTTCVMLGSIFEKYTQIITSLTAFL